MKKLLFIFLLISSSAFSQCCSTYTFSYSNSAVQRLGRWQTASGYWSGWNGAQLVFQIQGTSFLKINALVKDTGNVSVTYVGVDIDNAPNNTPNAQYYFTTAPEIYTGAKSVTIELPNSNPHTITIKSGLYPSNEFYQSGKITYVSFTINASGSVSYWQQGSKLVQMVGDSWAGATCDWARLMSTADYKIYQIGAGGYKCSDMDANYNYDYNGVLNTTDSSAVGVIVSFGVNDFLAGVTQASFETSMYALVDKIRAKQSTAKIFLVRIPKNLGSGEDFGKYGANMQNVANNRSNVYYVDTTSIDATVTWLSDNHHLDAAGSIVLANFVKASLIAQGI